jgi:streptogramin lyase
MLRRLRRVLVVAGIAMLVASIAQAAPIGTLKQFRIPTANGNPKEVTQGSDGNFWFTESHVNPPQTDNHHVGRITPVQSPSSRSHHPEAVRRASSDAPDGSVWFAQSVAGNVARITTPGVMSQGRRMKGSEPSGVTVAPDGNPWYAELALTRSRCSS